jgi:tripartite-type tricarboxylate transporter receptor subunit TctC
MKIAAKFLGVICTLLVFPASIASAQTKVPDGPIKFIVPFAAGGGVDTAARLIAKQLGTNLGVAVIVENRAGGSGTIGGKAVQIAPPDGQTLLFTASTHVLAKEVMKTPPYDPVKDFQPIARVAEAPLLMVTAPNLPQATILEVMAAAKQQPAKWTAALPALGAASHVGTLMVAKRADVQLTTTAYKGTAPALTDVAGGHAQILIDSIVSLLPMAKEGKVRPIAVTSTSRMEIAPNIPTAAESGMPGLVYYSWYGVWAPKGTPEAKALALNQALNTAVRDLVKANVFAPLGLLPVTEDIAQFQRFIETDVQRSAELLVGSGFKPE